MLIDEKALTAEIFERYDREAEAVEGDREHIAAFVSLAHSSYFDLQAAKNAWDFIDNSEAILEAGRAFEGCAGAYLAETVIALARETFGKDSHKEAVLLILFGVVKSAARVGMQLVPASLPPIPAQGGPTP